MALSPGMQPGRRSGRRRRHAPISEINVTPLVDVMLVLLIVFMISAPLLTVGVPIDLPESQAKPLTNDSEPITVTVDPQGRIFLQDSEVSAGEIVARLLQATSNNYDQRIYVRGDRTSNYGTIMQVMGTINGAGFRSLGLVTLPEQEN